MVGGEIVNQTIILVSNEILQKALRTRVSTVIRIQLMNSISVVIENDN